MTPLDIAIEAHRQAERERIAQWLEQLAMECDSLGGAVNAAYYRVLATEVRTNRLGLVA